METGATVLPHFFKDTTDRNRTSPFAFTGNKFEFRSLGSSLSVSGPNIILNTAVAEALSRFYDKIKDVPKADLDQSIHLLLKQSIREHKRVIFNGNGYTDEWVQEAEQRGLCNYRTTPDVLPVFIDPKNIDLFTRHSVFTEGEVRSRYEIMLEEYNKTIHIEAKTLIDMIRHQFLPALSKTIDSCVTLAEKKRALSETLSIQSDLAMIQTFSQQSEELFTRTSELAHDVEEAEQMSDELKMAHFYQETILSEMAAIRQIADSAEALMPKEFIPYPTYADMLFYV